MIGWLDFAEPGACDLLRSLKEDADKHAESPQEPLSSRAFNEIRHLRNRQREGRAIMQALVEIASGDSPGEDLLPIILRRARAYIELMEEDFILAGEFEFFEDVADDVFDAPEQKAERAA